MEEKKESVPVVGAKPGTKIEIAPGQTVAPIDIADVEQVAIADIVPQGDGTFRAVARLSRRWLAVSPRTLRRLGIDHSPTTLHRLIRAGFVRGRQPSPRVYEFELESYLEHLQACEDPEFWTEQRREFYRQSI